MKTWHFTLVSGFAIVSAIAWTQSGKVSVEAGSRQRLASRVYSSDIRARERAGTQEVWPESVLWTKKILSLMDKTSRPVIELLGIPEWDNNCGQLGWGLEKKRANRPANIVLIDDKSRKVEAMTVILETSGEITPADKVIAELFPEVKFQAFLDYLYQRRDPGWSRVLLVGELPSHKQVRVIVNVLRGELPLTPTSSFNYATNHLEAGVKLNPSFSWRKGNIRKIFVGRWMSGNNDDPPYDVSRHPDWMALPK